MSKPPKTTYRVTLPDGTVATRKSHRLYTHAVAVCTTPWDDPAASRKWYLLSCHDFEDLVNEFGDGS